MSQHREGTHGEGSRQPSIIDTLGTTVETEHCGRPSSKHAL